MRPSTELLAVMLAALAASACRGEVILGGSAVGPFPACSSKPTVVVASGVRTVAAGGGAMAYATTDGHLYVLRSKESVPIEVPLGPNAEDWPATLAVDDTFVGYRNTGFTLPWHVATEQRVTFVNYKTGATTVLGTGTMLEGPALSARVAAWTDIDPAGRSPETPVTWRARVDVSGGPVTYDIPGQPFAYGDAFAWIDSTQTLWTQPADRSAPPTKHAQIQLENLGWVTLTPTQGYLASGSVNESSPPGPPGIFTFSIDVGQPNLLASLLPPDYPLGPMANPGAWPTQPVVGPKRIFWAECWGNGVSLPVPGTSPPQGQDSPNSWVLRAVAPTGGAPETIDAFTWTDWMPQSPGFDTCPQVATDGRAVYWTHGTALMRLCE